MRARKLDHRERIDLVKAAFIILAILTASLYISLHVDPEAIHGPSGHRQESRDVSTREHGSPAHRRPHPARE